jgi:hypothetical protein
MSKPVVKSPYSVTSIVENPIRIYLKDKIKTWKIGTIFISSDGSYNHTFKPDHLQNSGKFKFTYHPTGWIWSSSSVRKSFRYKKFNWPNFKKITMVPLDGIGLDIADFEDPYKNWSMLEVNKVENPNVVFRLPKDVDSFWIKMQFGKPIYLLNKKALQEVWELVEGDMIIDKKYFKLVSFLDPADKEKFDVGVVVGLVKEAAQILR